MGAVGSGDANGPGGTNGAWDGAGGANRDRDGSRRANGDLGGNVSANGTGGDDVWAQFRRLTPARVGLARTGDAPSLAAVLDFQLGHARARDAINHVVDTGRLTTLLSPLPTLQVASAAADRATYLKRPDLGRQLSEASRGNIVRNDCDLAIVIGDGLSATAVERHAVPVVEALLPQLGGWRIGPVVIAAQARVALGDEIGERLGAAMTVVLIGERPGLSVSDSLGIYLTFGPRVGRRDAERNCISNIHLNGGLTPAEAAQRLVWLLREARARKVSGVALKDQSAAALPLAPPQ